MALKRPWHRFVRSERAAEFQERGGVGRAHGAQIDAGEVPQSLAVVEGFVDQGIPLLEEMNPKHALQSDGREAALALGIDRLNDGQQSCPRDDFLQAREKLDRDG